SSVLHRDDGLGGEVLEQRNFPLGEGTHLPAIHPENAQQFFVLAERDTHKAMASAEVDCGARAPASLINCILGKIVRTDDGRALNDLVSKAAGHWPARFAVKLGK